MKRQVGKDIKNKLMRDDEMKQYVDEEMKGSENVSSQIWWGEEFGSGIQKSKLIRMSQNTIRFGNFWYPMKN